MDIRLHNILTLKDKTMDPKEAQRLVEIELDRLWPILDEDTAKQQDFKATCRLAFREGYLFRIDHQIKALQS